MISHAKQIAWLSVAPEGYKAARANQPEIPERYKTPPDLQGAEYLTEIAGEIGLCVKGKPTPFSEFKAWCDLTGVALSAWEVEVLRAMAVAYTNFLQQAQDKNCPPPVNMDKRSPEEIRQDVTSKFKALAASRRKKSNKPRGVAKK